MASAGQVILIATISAIPIIVGTAYCCMGIFGSMSWRFYSLSESIIMLWAVGLGDEIQNIYHELLPLNIIAAFILCYTWTFFSNDFIMPAFLAITEDGYIMQSKTTKNSWLQDDLKDPDENIMLNLELEDEGPGALSCEQFLDNMKKNDLQRASKFIDWEEEGSEAFENYDRQKSKMRVQEMVDIEQ